MFDRNKQSGLTTNKYFKGKSLLPSEYQQIEYIQSSGTQYIDTNIVATTSLYIDISFKTLDYHSDSTIFGAGGWSTNQYLFIEQNNQLRFFGSAIVFDTFSANTNYRFVTSSNMGYLYKDGELISEKSITLSNNNNLILFAEYNKSHKGYYRLISCKLFKDTLVRYFIPCYRKSDNVAGLYDLVSNTFFTNQGSGEFIMGPEVN